MINRVSEDWREVERAARTAGNMSADQVDSLMRSISAVTAALRKMCEVSVTRTTLAAAVKEALPPILQDGGPQLFPGLYEEVARLRAKVEDVAAAVAESGSRAEVSATEAAEREARERDAREAIEAGFRREIAARLEDFEARVRRLSEFDEELRSVKDGMDEVDARVGALGARLSALEGRAEREDSAVADAARRLEGVAGEVREVEGRVRGVEGRLESTAASLEARLDELARSVQAANEETARKSAELEARREAALADLRSNLEDKLRGGLLVVEERIEGARTYFAGLLSKLEASVPGTVTRETAALESRIRKEIEDVVHTLDEKLSDLRRMLAGLDSRLETVSGRIESFEFLGPSIRSIEAELGELERTLGAISSEVGASGRGIADLGSAVSGGLGDLKAMLELGIQRWEADQSEMLERLSAIRDTLRDQFRKVSEQVTEQSRSLWGKITGRGEGGLRLSREDWEQLAGKMEGIISGLEAVLAKRRDAGKAPGESGESGGGA